MATTPKGFDQYDYSDEMGGPEQINAAELFVENLIGESKPTPGDLPSTGNTVGRTMFVESDKSTRTWDGAGWSIQSVAPVSAPPITYPSGFSAGSGMDLTRRDGMVVGTFYVNKASGSIAASELVATLPTGWRPLGVSAAACGIPAATGLRIDGTTGAITAVNATAGLTLVAQFCFRANS